MAQRGPRLCGVMASHTGPTGVREQGVRTKGLPRNLGDLIVSIGRVPVGAPGDQAPGSGMAPSGQPEKEERTAVVPRSRGTTKAKWDGRSEVVAAHSTCEAGIVNPSDPVEGRRCRITELLERKMKGTPNPQPISTKLERIAELARKMPGVALRTLAHHMDIEWMREAYRRTRKDGAAGVDGQTAREYEEKLLDNLQSLLDRTKSGRYKAPPVRRVYIPKGDGRKRPIGIPTLEDKVLQRAVLMALEAVYEQDFLDCSYGFRPGRSAHDALEALREHTMAMHGGWILETDIESFFDSVDRTVLRDILSKRVRDGVFVRLIGKWMNAGVMENGCVYHPDTGTPQGGVISPLLANIVLHEVVDVWFEEQVKPRLRGRAHLVRFADDLVMVFAREDDARRVMDVLPKRLGKYGLRPHPEKTRLVRFERPPYRSKPTREERPETFDFLGFTHYWAKSRKGNWVIKRKTQTGRFTRTLKRIAVWCRNHRHDRVVEQHRVLSAKLRGHDAYYGVTANSQALSALRNWAERIWRKWLSRRSRKANINWEKMGRILDRYPLPRPRIHHQWNPRAANP